ncbi:MAG: M20/M25/M40 family metallo-hydrolase, partial [Acidobacteria bacterium]
MVPRRVKHSARGPWRFDASASGKVCVPYNPAMRFAPRAVAALVALGALAAAGQVARSGGAASVRTATAPSFHLNRLALDVLRELVAIDTTVTSGSATRAAEAVRARLLNAGFAASEVVIAGPGGRKQNLVARYRGSGSNRRPLLLLAHADVVDARREDWSVDPFTLLERGGFLFGRGTIDMKDMVAAFVTNLIGLRGEGYRPDRDIVLAVTADEEGGEANGSEWLLRNRPDLIEASLCLTEGGGGQIHEGRYAAYTLQAAEKGYVTFSLEARSAGGHSSLPGPDNAIHRLAAALTRGASQQFPVALNEVTRTFFARMGPVEGGSVGRDMSAMVAGP